MWTHTCHAEGEARGTTITWANGMNKTSLCPLWEAMASVGGDCALTRLLEVTTGENGYLFCPWDGRNTSSILFGVSEKPSDPLRWDLTRGRGDGAQRQKHSWHDAAATQMETGELKEEVTWENITEVMRGVAEEAVGRESKTNDVPCLRVCRKEVLLSESE